MDRFRAVPAQSRTHFAKWILNIFLQARASLSFYILEGNVSVKRKAAAVQQQCADGDEQNEMKEKWKLLLPPAVMTFDR